MKTFLDYLAMAILGCVGYMLVAALSFRVVNGVLRWAGYL